MQHPQQRGNDLRSPRRTFLKTMGAAALALKGGLPVWAADAPAHVGPFRFAFLTDIHINPERRGDDGFRACLRAVHAMNPRPEFIVTGGDLVSDALRTKIKRADALYDLYMSVCQESKIPIHDCIGNHDICGWDSRSGVDKDDPLYGKNMFLAKFGMEKTSYSFDHKGWHFAIVDDIEPNPRAGSRPKPVLHGTNRCYEGAVSEENLAWLDRDLAAAGDRPKIIVAHIPFLSPSLCATATLDEVRGCLQIPTGSVCKNPGPIVTLLNKHKVGLTLTGHRHMNERADYLGTTHIVQTAVCGNWWRKDDANNPPGFGVVDVQPDGRFAYSLHSYAWDG